MREPVEVALQQSISIEEGDFFRFPPIPIPNLGCVALCLDPLQGYRFITSGTAGTPIRWELQLGSIRHLAD